MQSYLRIFTRTRFLTSFLSSILSSQVEYIYFFRKTILKPNSDLSLPASYRPIALSSEDSKKFWRKGSFWNQITSLPFNTVLEKMVVLPNLF